jgi:hypothetical protein
MSDASERADAYLEQLGLPWRNGISSAERVWMLPYPPADERRMRAQLPRMAVATRELGYDWAEVDVTDAFGSWLAHHEYADAFVADPMDLTLSLLDDFEAEVATTVRAALQAEGVGPRTVVALIGAGSLYPFVRASRLMEDLDGDVRGRLLVLFPGRYDVSGHNYRLLDARDGSNYRAVAILPKKDRS